MGFGTGRALVIGVASYRHVSGLPEAVRNDARDVAAVLQEPNYCGYPSQNVQLLLDNEATLVGIRAGLAELVTQSALYDTVLIYFSGHGTRIGSGASETSALVTNDTELSDVTGTTLGESEFSSALENIKVRRLLVIIDACHSGGAGSFKGIEDFPNGGFGEKSLDRLAHGIGRVILASSRASETSLVLNGARNSVFTEKLLEALRGRATTLGDDLIRVFDVFNYVSENVRKAVPGRQHPIFKASQLEDNFPIAFDGSASAKTAATVGQPERWRDLEQIMAALYPAGPTDQDIWRRAGGYASRLKLTGSGRARWFSALRTLSLGGGGGTINRNSLLSEALDEFPHHSELAALVAAADSQPSS